MAQVNFVSGDRFIYEEKFGMVLPTGKALLFKGEGWWRAVILEVGDIPSNASPLKKDGLCPAYVRLAMDAVAMVLRHSAI